MITAIIQARLNSSRLKRKILLKIQDKNLLQHLFSLLSYSRQIDKKIIATTIDKMDNEIEEFAKSENITCFRGNINAQNFFILKQLLGLVVMHH